MEKQAAGETAVWFERDAMLNLPVPPRTRISRQLKCVSCQEPFTVSEDDPDRPYNIGNNWQSPVTNSSDIQLHYQDDRT
ncbi:MAG: hypothetical protein P8183_23665, partial [Anaerolineae bacterium]